VRKSLPPADIDRTFHFQKEVQAQLGTVTFFLAYEPRTEKLRRLTHAKALMWRYSAALTGMPAT
jgi:hypothetical protein